MIAQGRRRAEADGIPNMVWRQGEAESLPFPDESFDLAITRYSIHHFVDPSAVLREMARTCRPDGTIVAVDMVSDEDPAVASRQDALETVMDPTHTSVLSPSRLVQAATGGGLTVQGYLSRDVPMSFDLWQAHVPADSGARATVRRALEEELAGGERTGMRPFRRDGALLVQHDLGFLTAAWTFDSRPMAALARERTECAFSFGFSSHSGHRLYGHLRARYGSDASLL
jgi:SAM-dependent methyltransferase